MDVVDTATRSRMMAGIRARNTKPEIQIRRILHASGFRFRLHIKDLPGKPDIVLPRFKAIIFVHGCFWHGHACKLFKWPSTRAEFWREKIERNKVNDGNAINSLIDSGWRVAIIWECYIRPAQQSNDGVGLALARWLFSEETRLELKA